MFQRFTHLCLTLSLRSAAYAAQHNIILAPVPAEIPSSQFLVTINGHSTPVDHAALNLYFLNFEAREGASTQVTAPTDDFWATGVKV